MKNTGPTNKKFQGDFLVSPRLDADRLAYVLISVARQKLYKALIDPFDDRGAAIDKARDDLYERSARLYLFVRVFCGKNAAEADQDIFPVRLAIDVADQIR